MKASADSTLTRQEISANVTSVGMEKLPADGGRSKIYLHPGQLFASAERSAVSTILGSCVAVCLWDPLSRIGGINHYLLPQWTGEGAASPRFGNVAVQDLLNKLLELGSQKRRLQAKLFGGACVIEAFRKRGNHLGTKNVQAAEELLEKEGIPLVGHDVGGCRGRKLIFHTDNGTAWVKQL
jgi:chemotaxis protein CheD